MFNFIKEYFSSPKQNIEFYVGDVVVGVAQSIEIVSTLDNGIKINTTRVLLNKEKLNLTNAFSKNYIYKDSQRYPFQIKILNNPKVLIENCWIIELPRSSSSNEVYVTEGMILEAEKGSITYAPTNELVYE